MAEEGKDRIAKVMARAGLCSRREAERWIQQGRVAVNGKVLESPACVISDKDRITVDGQPLPRAEKTRLFLYHKPAALVTTAHDDMGRKTIFDELPKELPRVVTIGRLDMNTEGLLLLTNDGELARYLELPQTGWKRRYRVRVHGKVTESKFARLAKGMTVDGIRYGPIEAEIDKTAGEKSGTNTWLHVALREGKNREIRKVMAALDLQVNRLIRIAYGPFQLGSLPKGAVKEVPEKVIKEQIRGFKA